MCLCCYNKIPQAGWLKQQIFNFFGHFWSLEVLDKRQQQGRFPLCEDREFYGASSKGSNPNISSSHLQLNLVAPQVLVFKYLQQNSVYIYFSFQGTQFNL